VDGAWLAKGPLAISSSYMSGGGAMKANWTVWRVNILVADSVLGIRDGDEGDVERLRKPGVGMVACSSRDRRDCFPFSECDIPICSYNEESGLYAWVRRSPGETGWEKTKRQPKRHVQPRYGKSGPAVLLEYCIHCGERIILLERQN